MVDNKRTRLVCATVFLCLAACAPDDPSSSKAAADSQIVPAAAVASKAGDSGAADTTDGEPTEPPLKVGDALLSISSRQFAACAPPYGSVVATARWDATPMAAERVEIYVESPGNEKKLWTNGGVSGQAETGPWVYDQTRFTLTDAKSGKVLAERTLQALPCK